MELDSESTLQINQNAKAALLEASKWGKFLAILGFVFIGIIVIAGMAMGSIMGKMGGAAAAPFASGAFTLIYLVIGIIYIFPVLYLYRFSTSTKSAIEADDSDVLATAFENLKSLYKFMGVFSIITLVIYALMIGGMVIAKSLF
jgi:hypothetical protein